MRRNRSVLTIAAVWMISAALWLQPGLLLPDGAGYVVYLPSAWISRDLLFFDEWQALGMIENGVIRHKDITATSHLGNHWTVGSALTWFPAFAAADALRPLTEFPRNGFSLPYNIAVIMTSALAGLVTLLAGFAVARTVAGGSAASFAAIGVWFGTTLMWYSLVHATMAHAVSAMAAALVFAAAMALRKHAEPAMAFLAGLAVGWAFIVRPQNGALGLVPPIVAPMQRGLTFWYAGGIAAGALPQLVVSWFLYGSFTGFLTGGGSATPFAAFQKIWTWEPLFSWYHGLFTWTPLALAGVIGLFLLLRIDRRLAIACLLTFVLQWVINATMERSFWGALSFGQRRFDNCIIVFLIGLAALLRDRSAATRIAIVALPAAWTFTLFLAARGSLVDLIRYVQPGALFQAQWNAFLSLPSALVPFGSTPAPFRMRVALLMILFTVVVAGAAFLVLRLPRVARAGAAAAYFIGAALFLFLTGLGDASELSRYETLIARNRVYSQIPGGADVRFGLLRDEIEYLRHSGREEEARATERELTDLESRRADALARIAPHRVLPALAKYHYGCISGNHTYRLIGSAAELQAFARALSEACDVEERRFLDDVDDARVDFAREVLVLVEQFYGGTGMARASLSLSGPEEGAVGAAIEITVPPPPVTPDVARFPFAFAVARQNVDRIEITVDGAPAASFPIAK